MLSSRSVASAPPGRSTARREACRGSSDWRWPSLRRRGRGTAREALLLATLALASGVGSATAIYTVVNGVMLKPLGYRSGERFMSLVESDRIATEREIILSTMTLERSVSLLATFFACAALLMATLGVYGVIAYAIRQRSLEIGMRLMLGASARDVLALILSDGVRLALYGTAAGGIVAVGGAAVLARVFDTVATGLMAYVYSAAIVFSLAVAASLVPALRASLSSPLSVLRSGS